MLTKKDAGSGRRTRGRNALADYVRLLEVRKLNLYDWVLRKRSTVNTHSLRPSRTAPSAVAIRDDRSTSTPAVSFAQIPVIALGLPNG